MLHKICAICLVYGLVAMPAAASPIAELNQAIAFINAHEEEKAKPLLQSVIQDGTASSIVKGNAYHALSVTTRSARDALTFCAKAAELVPGDATIQLTCARLAFTVHDYAAAETAADKALAVNPASVGGYTLRGLARHRLSRPQEAAADFDKAMELNPTCANHIRRAAALYDLGRDADALNDIRAAAQKKPDAVQRGLLNYYFGKIQMRAGNVAKAEKALNHALQQLADEKKKRDCQMLLQRIKSQKEWM